jgi:hypothetical protein
VNPLNTHVHLQDKAKHHFLSTEIPAVPGWGGNFHPHVHTHSAMAWATVAAYLPSLFPQLVPSPSFSLFAVRCLEPGQNLITLDYTCFQMGGHLFGVCVCVCVRERERVWESVCVCERVCVYVWERESVCVCVERVKDRLQCCVNR